MTARFLELGIAAPDVLESLQFYRALGFTELATGEAWPHRYAVVTDGRIVIGLHDVPVASPAVTFVQPSLRRHVLALQDAGTPFEAVRLGEDEFNHALLRDPADIPVLLVEARTYSPPSEESAASCLGELLELALPVRDPLASARFWAPLAPRVVGHREEPAARFRLAADELVLGLGATPPLSRPALVYAPARAEALQSVLDQLGMYPVAGPPFAAGAFGAIRAPEGTEIVLLREDYWPGET